MNSSMKTGMTLVGLLMAACSIVACGDDEGDQQGAGGKGPGESALDGKAFQDLTASEKQTFCVDLQEMAVLSKEDTCELGALVASATGAGDCEELKQACLDGPEEPPTEGACDVEETDLSGCTLTVGEYKACVEVSVEGVRSLSCQSKSEDLTQGYAECELVKEKCPALVTQR